MRVVHLYKDYYPVIGGIENHIKALAEGQARRGHEVIVLASSPDGHAVDHRVNGLRAVLVPRLATIWSTPISPRLFTELPRLKPDLVHLHFPHPPGEIAQLLAGRHAPAVITYHSDIVRQRRLLRLYDPILRRVLDNAVRIVVTSPAYGRTSPHLRDRADKVRVVPLGVEVERFDDATGRVGQAARRRWDVPADAFLVVFVGRLRYYKGVEFLLEAMARVPNAHLLLVGDGALRKRARDQARALGLIPRVRFTGDVPDEDLPGCYLAGDVFVLPSTLRAEAFGTSIVEAMAAGLPVITTEIQTGTSWVNQHGLTGLVVPPGDAPALAAAITHLSQARDLRRTMGSAGRTRAREHFRAATMVEGIERVYAEALEELRVES